MGRNIRTARTANGWSQEELADRSTLHRTYISQLERGVKNATLIAIEKVAIALGKRPGQLLDD